MPYGKHLGFATFLLLVFIIATIPAGAQNEKNPIIPEIKNNCAEKWPGNYRMQKYCITEEMKAAIEVIKIADTYAQGTEEQMILLRCMGKWEDKIGYTYRMTVYCANEELKAYKSLQ